MIERLTLKNFRLFKDASIEFASGVPTVLIGPNASGKSSIIEALDILAGMTEKNTLDVLDGSGRGGVARIASWRKGSKRFELTLYTSPISKEWTSVRDDRGIAYELSFVGRSGGSVVSSEDLFQIDGEGVIPLISSGTGEGGRVLRDAPYVVEEKYDKAGEPSEYTLLRSVSKIYNKRAYRFKEILGGLVWYPGFAAMQQWVKSRHDSGETLRDAFVPNPSERLERRGYNLAATLYSMKEHHEERWERVLWHWQQEFPFVKGITFAPVSRLLPMWRHKDYEEALDWSQMSDGMLSMLCLLTALFQPHDAAIYCFDEPEQHLHPSLIRRFVLAAEEAARELDRRILIVTHSDRLLDFLSDPAKSLRIASSDGNEAKIETIEEDFLESWLEQYTLSQLRARGQLDPLSNDEY